MASRQGSKSRKTGFSNFKGAADSTASSTTSSSKLYQETSIDDGHSSPASSSAQSKQHFFSPDSVPQSAQRSKENVTVTVRFRPLSPREIRQGEEVAWYADGETIVRNEYNPTIAYAYDRVFGPTTTTRNVYDVAAHHVVNGAMEGINGTIFAYGVTSSGKTHTMHGDQRSPGIIPLAVKDAFSIIQETPNREFLLRISYMEIYNEVVNDLLNPAGQNLRIREDKQGTFVEGIKEEVVLSPAHALSLIAAGEEQRHVGSTNYNLLSSRSHTIFTLTIESSPLGNKSKGEAVHLSQLNLVDLAGSESSKVETSGVRRKEGSYINKSLLTLGTVISKLTDVKASHVPYRDSKLTRILQSSLSGHDRVSLICTVTPASSSSEETHNTLKFAHRAKHIEIQAEQNKIIDEKSLIKKYQHEIQQLKEELGQIKQGIVPIPQLNDIGTDDDIVHLKQKLEDGQVKLQSRLEEEEEAKAALMSRIQRLTKLILVSTKTSQTSRLPHRFEPRRRHSFGEEELAYLPYKRRDMMDDEHLDLYVSGEGHHEVRDIACREEKKTRKHGLLNWLKPKKRDNSSSASDQSSVVKSNSTPSTPQGGGSNLHGESRLSEGSPLMEQFSEPKEDREALEDTSHEMETPEASNKVIDELDLMREQKKILSEEAALQSSSLKRLLDEAAKSSPQTEETKEEEIKALNDDIKAKNDQIVTLEKQILDFVMTSHEALDKSDIVQALAEMRDQLNEKSFELEVKAADNSIIQEQLNQKTCECETWQEEVANLKRELSDALELAQETKIEELKQKAKELSESKEQLEHRNRKLAEESSYAKGLASAAAVELKALSEEVAKLMNHNERLAAELAALKSSVPQRGNKTGTTTTTTNARNNGRRESLVKRQEQESSSMELKRELRMSKERERSYEAALVDRDQREAELERIVEESKQREAYLENELASMWVLVSKLRRSQGGGSEISDSVSETLQTDRSF
ncbi:P-loop containing nucleoside triphosphate hydrolases superfamily protein [Raphanus sativus]|uniref:Kinesin-like protein n=1 Tax=Raphanus sativus TaxID=3726 RepID=A0A6J0P871_RAPSA|nr:kinesin-like protein KIN-7K, chloroplastic [Raphanus sativus]KAJ4893419.1 P-loop containing nucleoside triphosphate hydrolases superfamily protein [Raphanus sativus]